MIKIDFKPSTTQLAQFGWIALFGFPLAAVVAHKFATGESLFFDAFGTVFAGRASWWVYLLCGLGGLSALLALVAPAALKPIYILLMIVAIPIGFVISAVLLRLIYYLVFTPMALWFRVRGRDAMNRTLEPDRDSYWQDHRDVANPRSPASYFRLY